MILPPPIQFSNQFPIQQQTVNNITNKKQMKFTRSSRNFHPSNFNPPCTSYQPQSQLNFIKIPIENYLSLPNKNTFGSTIRFNSNKDTNPAPGFYDKDDKSIKLLKILENNKCRLKKINKKSMNSPPSIPYWNFHQNKNNDQQQKQPIALQINSNTFINSKITRKKLPGYSFSKQERNCSCTPKAQTKNESTKIKELQMKEIDNQKEKCIHKKFQAIHKIDPQFITSLQLISQIKKQKKKIMAQPPTNTTQKFTQFFQALQSLRGTSFPLAPRFTNNTKISNIDPGIYNPKSLGSTHKFSFGKSQKTGIPIPKQYDYQFYINPQNREQNRKNRNKSLPFGSTAIRFTDNINKNGDDGGGGLGKENQKSEKEKLYDLIKKQVKKINENIKNQGMLGISSLVSAMN